VITSSSLPLISSVRKRKRKRKRRAGNNRSGRKQRRKRRNTAILPELNQYSSVEPVIYVIS
jgi:hypothetical protein